MFDALQEMLLSAVAFLGLGLDALWAVPLTIITFLAIDRNIPLLTRLLEAGADVNFRVEEVANTPLEEVIQWRSWIEPVKCLLEHGADVNAADNNRRSALHYEADSPCFCEERLIILLEGGANPLALDKQGATPLTLAKKHVIAFYKDALSRLEKATDAAQTKRAQTMAKQMDWYIDRSKE